MLTKKGPYHSNDLRALFLGKSVGDRFRCKCIAATIKYVVCGEENQHKVTKSKISKSTKKKGEKRNQIYPTPVIMGVLKFLSATRKRSKQR
ncbi:hypothetical protein QE152_g33347 [Popillia japonica]|uniref:Uncharacterized protein n=1 Tax=Popillia japonica TaxID=7064 RepID=A0AAW1IX51_POPJA